MRLDRYILCARAGAGGELRSLYLRRAPTALLGSCARCFTTATPTRATTYPSWFVPAFRRAYTRRLRTNCHYQTECASRTCLPLPATLIFTLPTHPPAANPHTFHPPRWAGGTGTMGQHLPPGISLPDYGRTRRMGAEEGSPSTPHHLPPFRYTRTPSTTAVLLAHAPTCARARYTTAPLPAFYHNCLPHRASIAVDDSTLRTVLITHGDLFAD